MSTARIKFGDIRSSAPEITMVELGTFAMIAKTWPNISESTGPINPDEIFRIGRAMGTDDKSDIRFAVVHGTLLW